MIRIAVDIDNTLFNFEAAARQVFLDLAHERGDKSLFKGAYNPWQEWRSMTDVCGDNVCWEVIERVHSPAIIAQQRPFPGSRMVLEELANEYELLYISNRSPEALEATEEWLDNYDFPEGELVCNLNDKVAQVNRCQYIIDDRPKTLVQFVHDFTWRYSNGGSREKRRLGFGLAFPYNQALTDIPNVYLAPTWNGIKFYLQEKGVLNAQPSNGSASLTG